MEVLVRSRHFAMLLRLLALALASAQGSAEAEAVPAADATHVFHLGSIFAFTSFSQEVLVGLVAFDLDFRKNFEPALVERFGPPVVPVDNLNPALRIGLTIGTSHSDMSIGLQTTLELLLGSQHLPKAVGLLGAGHSWLSTAIAPLAAVFQVPQMSCCSLASELSDKVQYPYFSRIAPPSGLQGLVLWAWVKFFDIPSVAFLYGDEAYGRSIYQSTLDASVAQGEGYRINGVPIANMPDPETYDVELAREAARSIKATSSRFIILSMGEVEVAPALSVLEEEGLYNSGVHQFAGSHTFLIRDGPLPLAPASGLLPGVFRCVYVSQGPLWTTYADMVRKMVPDDIYGADALERYKIDHFAVPFDNAAQPMVTLADLQMPETLNFRGNMFFDAAYTFVFAINGLLNAGMPAKDIFGDALLIAVRNASFEGITGTVGLDQRGDRLASYGIQNSRRGADGKVAYTTIAEYSAALGSFSSFTSTPLWTTGDESLTVPSVFLDCPRGYARDSLTTKLCLPCPDGWFAQNSSMEGEQECIPCPAGWVSADMVASTACRACPAGSFRSTQDTVCTPCARGTFTASSGMSACEACAMGSFGEADGLSRCELCGQDRHSQHHFATMYGQQVGSAVEYAYLIGATKATDCTCDRHFRMDSSGECVECTDGMICRGMNSVEIESGYFSEAQLSVFRCYGDEDRCRGGLPGATCAVGRESLVCAECKKNWRPAGDGECEPCEDADSWPLVLVTGVSVALLVLVYYIVETENRATQSHALLLCAIAIGLFVTLVQQLGVVSNFEIIWKEPLRSLMSITQLLTLDVELFRINCVANQTPLQVYILKLMAIFIVVGVMLLIHVAFVFLRHNGAFRQQKHVLLAAVGTLFMVFYITVTTTVLEPMQCQHHPNGKWTIRAYPSILCWDSEDHTAMVTLGALTFVAVPVSYFAGCVYVVRHFPARMRAGDALYLKTFSFLFFRFRASRCWYVLVALLRSFLVACVLVIPDAMSQVFSLQVVLLVAFGISLISWPWRVDKANILDCFFGGGMLLAVCLASFLLDEQSKNSDGIALLCFILILIVLALAPVSVIYGICARHCNFSKPFQFFLCHYKLGSGAYARLLKMYLIEHPRVTKKVFIDSDNLDSLDKLFEYVSNSTATLVVLCTTQIFTRAWCVGEMCTARLKAVGTLRISFPGCEYPDDIFIKDLALRISSMSVLTECGMSLEMLQETLQWMSTCPDIQVPSSAGKVVMSKVVAALLHKGERQMVDTIPEVDEAPSLVPKGKSVVVFDSRNLEAQAAANLMLKMMMPLLSHSTDLIPTPLSEGPVPKTVENVLILCTVGLFESRAALELLSEAGHAFFLLPVMAEVSFRVPGPDDMLRLQELFEEIFTTERFSYIVSFITIIFKEIALNFLAQSANSQVLKVNAEDIANRLDHASGRKSRQSGTIASLIEKNPTQITALCAWSCDC